MNGTNELVGKIALVVLVPILAVAVWVGGLDKTVEGSSARLDTLETKMDQRSETQAAILAQLQAMNRRLDELTRQRNPGL